MNQVSPFLTRFLACLFFLLVAQNYLFSYRASIKRELYRHQDDGIHVSQEEELLSRTSRNKTTGGVDGLIEKQEPRNKTQITRVHNNATFQPSSPDEVDSDEKAGKTTTSSSRLHTAPSVLLFNGTKCEVVWSSLKYLGSGVEGKVYAASMECPAPLGSRSTRIEKVALKFSTIEEEEKKNGSRRTILKYVSTSPEPLVTYEELYGRMMGTTRKKNNERDKVKRHFAFQLGTVKIPPQVLLYHDKREAKKRGKSSATYYDDGGLWNEKADASKLLNTSMITGKVFSIAPGKSLQSVMHKRLDVGTRRKIVKDLVYMYRYMYERRVLHCDISLSHFYFDTSTRQTTLIDFDRVLVLAKKSNDDDIIDSTTRQKWQLWQLLNLIGTLCDDDQGESPSNTFPVINTVCLASYTAYRYQLLESKELVQRLTPAMEKCGFEQHIDWTERLLNNTRRAYRELARLNR